jgi:hypothetical protein
MISFHQFINLKEALSLADPLAQSILKIKYKNNTMIEFEFILDENNYQIKIYLNRKPISIQYEQHEIVLDIFNLMYISLKVNRRYSLTNKSGMQANKVYNMLLNAMKQAHDHFGENNVHGYEFSGAESAQDLMYDRLMRRFAPNLITWSTDDGIYLKPEAVQKLKDQNPHMIEEINDHIHQATSEKEISIQQAKKDKSEERKERRLS